MKNIFAALALAALLFVAGGSATMTSTASAAPLTNSPWCANKDSIAIMGGSTNTGFQSSGYPANPGSYAGYYPTTYGWWSRVTTQLNAYYGTADDGVVFKSYNYARNGASAHNFLPGGAFPEAMNDLATTKPNLLIISVGSNEYLGQLNPTQFQTNLTALIDAVYARTNSTAVMLAVQHEIGIANPTYTYSQYAQVIYNVAATRYAAVIDMRQVAPSDAAGNNPAGLYNADKIHLSDAGQLVYAARYWSALVSC